MRCNEGDQGVAPICSQRTVYCSICDNSPSFHGMLAVCHGKGGGYNLLVQKNIRGEPTMFATAPDACAEDA